MWTEKENEELRQQVKYNTTNYYGKVVQVDNATGAVISTGNKAINKVDTGSSQREPWWSGFRLRWFTGAWVLALVGALIFYQFSVTAPYTGLVFLIIGGLGTYRALTRESKYIRYSKWVLGLGLGLVGLLNALATFEVDIWGEREGVHFITHFKFEENPFYTISILVLTFFLASLTMWFEYKSDIKKE